MRFWRKRQTIFDATAFPTGYIFLIELEQEAAAHEKAMLQVNCFTEFILWAESNKNTLEKRYKLNTKTKTATNNVNNRIRVLPTLTYLC